MRTIERTTQFKRDLRREKKGRHRATIVDDTSSMITALANGESLDGRHRDHAMVGIWKDHRDCHIKPDLVMIYRFLNADTLQLVRLGSHSELGI